MATLRAGAARADMTPPAGTLLAGGWRPKPAEAVDTPLMAHALVLDDGATRLAVVALDLIALAAEQANEAKARIQERTGIPREHVLIACSHTHEAPYPCPLLGCDTGPDPAYLARVVDAIVASVAQAADRLIAAEVGFGVTRVPGICGNRRCLKGPSDVFNTWMLSAEERETLPAAGPVDDELLLLAVRKKSGEPLALLWNFTLHAHAFNGPRVCADYPWYVGRKVAERMGADLISVFTAGACGDINRRRDAKPQMIVDRLSEGLVKIYGESDFTREVALSAGITPIELALRDSSVFQEEEIRRKLPRVVEIAREEWGILRELKERSVSTVVQVMAVGDFAMACVPGEYFAGLGLNVKSRSPFARTVLVELSNDYVGYIPWAEAYDQGGYELFNARSSKVARGSGEQIADALVRMLSELYQLKESA